MASLALKRENSGCGRDVACAVPLWPPPAPAAAAVPSPTLAVSVPATPALSLPTTALSSDFAVQPLPAASCAVVPNLSEAGVCGVGGSASAGECGNVALLGSAEARPPLPLIGSSMPPSLTCVGFRMSVQRLMLVCRMPTAQAKTAECCHFAPLSCASQWCHHR